MRFGVYRGAQGGIGKAMQAFTGGGKTEQSAYDDSLGKYADIEYRRAGADKYRSEAALNQQTFGAGEDLRRQSIAGTLQGIVPQGVDPTAFVTGYMAAPNRSFADFTKGGQNLTGGIASQAALIAADAGDVDALNRFNSVAKPGTQYSPYSLNETGLLHGATGQHEYTPGHQALVSQREAAAGASNAAANASNALANQRRFMDVAPGASLYDVAGGIAGMLPGADAPPPVQPGASITGMLPGVEPAGVATPGAGPQPAGVAQPMAQPFVPAGGPRLVATAPGKPDSGKLVEVYDPNSPTGTSWVTQQDAIGRPGKPGSKGVSITYDEQGRPIVEMGGRDDLTTTAKNTTDTKILESGDTLSQLTAIRSRFKPEYQQIGTRWSALRSSVLSKAGFQIDPQDRQQLREFSTYRAEAGQMFSNILKTLSGAAVTPAEMKRAEAWLPNPGTGLWDGDDPETLAAKLDRMEDFTRKALAKYSYVKRNGLDISAVDVDQMPQLMRQRGDQIAAELQAQGVPGEQLGIAVKQRLADEFGLGAY